jgi:restriction system protein
MAIPTFDKLLRPVLELAAHDPTTRRTATDAMASHFKLTPEEADSRLSSGGLTIADRVSWAMTFLTKAGLISKVATKTYQATGEGRSFLQEHPITITVQDLRAIPGFDEAWNTGRTRRQKTTASETPSDATSTPREIITREVTSLNADLRGRLLQLILEQTPDFFEQLVLDVLLAMGYGGSRSDAAQRLGRSGDEGIDGCINQDALGLDQVMVQAKRYKPDNIIDRKTIQAFIGSLTGQGVTKGVFITTSSFAETAREFVLRGSTTKVVLIDGAMLIDLMIQHHIGVRIAHTYEIHELDQNYFEESE